MDVSILVHLATLLGNLAVCHPCRQGRQYPVPLKSETVYFYLFFLSVSLSSSATPIPRGQSLPSPSSLFTPFLLIKLPVKSLSAWQVCLSPAKVFRAKNHIILVWCVH